MKNRNHWRDWEKEKIFLDWQAGIIVLAESFDKLTGRIVLPVFPGELVVDNTSVKVDGIQELIDLLPDLANREEVEGFLLEGTKDFAKSGFVFWRLDEEGRETDSTTPIVTNVPWNLVWHSPNGMNYGYRGSGPADFALNIVEAILRSKDWEDEGKVSMPGKGEAYKLAVELHQPFKQTFIEKANPLAGHFIPFDDAVFFCLNEGLKILNREFEKMVASRDG